MQIKYSGIIVEPITLSEAKSWLKMDGITADDTLITSLITQIRELAEEVSGRALVVKTIEYFEDDYDEIKAGVLLPFPNHNEILEVKVNDVDTYYVKTGLSQFKLHLGVVTSSLSQGINLYVKYTTLAYCPAGLKLAMMKEIAQAYEKRGSTSENSQAALTSSFINYLSQFKVY